MTVQPLIEQWFPASIIGAESMRERGAASALPPINFLHVWWARRPLIASRAAVVASLLPAWPSEEEASTDHEAAGVLRALTAEFPGGSEEYHQWFTRAIGILGDPVAGRQSIRAAVAEGTTTAGNAYGYDRAFTVSPDFRTIEMIRRLTSLRGGVSDVPVVLDPFSGGGSIPFEAARFGFDTIANELNPVAAAILHGTVGLPATLGPGFATTIEHWGARWASLVEKRLAPFFPREHLDERLAYIWAHTVPCPTTGRPTPLVPDYWLATGKAGRDVAVRLEGDATTGEMRHEIIEGDRAREWGSRSTYKHGVGTSIWTGETFSSDYIHQHAASGAMGEMLLAVSVTRPGRSGRQFRVPSADDLDAVVAADAEYHRLLPRWEIEDLVPSEERFIGPADRSARYGIRLFRQMFTSRQLLTTITAVEELRRIVQDARSELDQDQTKALDLFLAFALDCAVNYNGRLSSWHSSRVTIRSVFDRHDFSFKWTFAELDGASSLIPWAVFQIWDAYKKISSLVTTEGTLLSEGRTSRASITIGSATALELPSESVDAVITDPPYYDNVMYAECSDYFLVWQRRILRDTWPELGTAELSDKESEVVANSSLFEGVATSAGGGRRVLGTKTATELADEHYERLLTQAFGEAHRVLKDNGVLTVMFTHKRVDAWDTLGQALLESGFAVGSSWPVHTESEHSLHQAKKNAASSTIFLTCRKRGSTTPAYWADIRGEIAAIAREAAAQFSESGLTGIDLTISTFGPVLGVLSRSWPVLTGQLDGEGNPQVLRPDVALDLAREEVSRLKIRGLLGGRDVEFDRVTDWYLLAWADFGAAEFPFDEGRKLSIAMHLEMDDLAKVHKIVRSSSGTVTILTPAQRRTAKGLDPDAATWPTQIDALHALMLVYEEEGLSAAKAWLSRTGKADDQRFHDLVEAAIRAVPRVKDKGEFVRPEARALEGLRATLFDDIAAPADPDEAPAKLFEMD